MVRINRVYTRTGDAGETGLVGGERVAKDSLRIECYGTVDELNATLGLVGAALAASPAGPRLVPILLRVQNELFNLGAQLAAPDEKVLARMPGVEPRHITALELEIDELNEALPELKSFVLPGGGEVSARLHISRTVCRRAERLVVTLARESLVPPHAVIYLNRLSDALFVHGRWAAQTEGRPEPLWEPEKS
ncbi:MAG: cob(I)yrinic acid a,c-diamide adenosyltransferase [Myxococcales bacterium]|nr:cob(I)yrinic acid a,c-diamide adenosyltransferase [Myxococcales bacterium]